MSKRSKIWFSLLGLPFLLIIVGACFRQKLADHLYALALSDNSRGTSELETEAFRLLELSSWLGNVEAMVDLGFDYASGRGTKADLAASADWYERAAERGDAQGMLDLGLAFYTGQGVTADNAKAVEWMQKAADGGDAQAMFNMGVFYFEGKIVPPDHANAVEWWTKAVDAGSQPAILNLANVYARGDGVEKSFKHAFELYLKDADDFHEPNAAYVVGGTYLGHGEYRDVAFDSKKGLYYMGMAANGGVTSAMLSMADYARDTEHDVGEYKRFIEMAADAGYNPALFTAVELLVHAELPESERSNVSLTSADLDKAKNYLSVLKSHGEMTDRERARLVVLEEIVELQSKRLAEVTAPTAQ